MVLLLRASDVLNLFLSILLLDPHSLLVNETMLLPVFLILMLLAHQLVYLVLFLLHFLKQLLLSGLLQFLLTHLNLTPVFH